MSGLSLFSSDGKKLKDVTVPEGMLSGPVRKGLLYYAVRFQRARARAGTHDSRTRGQVRGSTRKIYRQKGTGRARHGDKKAPIFVGGGKTFGPHPRNYDYSMPKTSRRRALQSALVLKNKEGSLKIVERPQWNEAKTKQAVAFFKGLKSESALLVLETRDTHIEKSVANLNKFKVLPVEGLNVYDILNFNDLFLTEAALAKVGERLKMGKA